MSKPTKQELEHAIAVAIKMRETGHDHHFLAKAFLNCHYQYTYLEEVLHAAERFLHSGMAEREHAVLLKAIEKARRVDERSAKQEHRDLGLG